MSGPDKAAVALAAARKLRGLSDELFNLAERLDVVVTALSPASETNPGVDEDAWAAYVDSECKSMLDRP